MKNLLVTCFLFATITGTAFGKSIKLNPDRTINIIGVIEGDILDAARDLDELSGKKSKDPIYILINSPGGMIAPGLIFVNSMIAAQERGANLVCVIGTLAASMAFNLLPHCDSRFSLRYTLLLFHPPRVMAQGPLLARDLESAAKSLNSINNLIVPGLKDMLGMDEDEFDYHYQNETLFTAEELVSISASSFLTIVDSIEGTDKAYIIMKPRSSLFGEIKEGIEKDKEYFRPGTAPTRQRPYYITNVPPSKKK